MGKSKRVNTIEELRSEFDNHEPFTTYQRFMAQALMFLAENSAKPSLGEKRKPSAWNTFFGKGMQAGKSPSQIAKEWRERSHIRKVG